MAISAMGIGSGIDVKGLVQQLLAAEGQPATQRLDRQEVKYQAQLSALGTLKGALSGFSSSLYGLTTIAGFNKRTATSNDTDLFTATASKSATAGSYQVEVVQLAKAQSLRSQAFADSTTSVGTGTLTFQFGDPTAPTQTVTIGAGNDSLVGIRDAVNAANIGVQASIVNGDDGYQLVFTSKDTGSDNSLKITVSEDPAAGTNTDNTQGLSRLAYDPDAPVGDGQNLVETAAAQDAVAKINGITVTRSSNTITDALDGVTLTLKDESTAGVTTGLTIAVDKNSVSTAIEGFVTAYNSLAATVKTLSGYNAETKQGGVLIGDAAVRGITSQIRNILGDAVSGLTGSYQSLADIGIKTNADGTLALDKTKLSAALTADFDGVGKLFAAAGTPTDSLVSFDSATSATKQGRYSVFIDRLASAGTYSDPASSVSSLLVDATNDTFAIKVDGISSGTITLTQKTYASGAELAAELQSRINGDTNLQDAGVSVSVAFDGTRFSFTSGTVGSDSAVEIVSVDDVIASGTIGLTANPAAATAGEDVAGQIGGVDAIGSGQFLTGTGNAAGLKLEISGSDLNERGTVVFSRGVADKVDTLLDSLLASDSFLANRTESINDSIEGITEQRETLTRRLEALDKRLTAQFTAMDTLVAQLNSTGNYLAQQLASLSNLNQ